MSSVIFDIDYDFISSLDDEFAVDIVTFDDVDSEQRRLLSENDIEVFNVQLNNRTKRELTYIRNFFRARYGAFDNFNFKYNLINENFYRQSGGVDYFTTDGTTTVYYAPESPIYAPGDSSTYLSVRLINATTGAITAVATSAYTVVNNDNKITFTVAPASGYYLSVDYSALWVARFMSNKLSIIPSTRTLSNVSFQIKKLNNETAS